jgi:hypothetical protein
MKSSSSLVILEYDYEIDAVTGAILRHETELDD